MCDRHCLAFISSSLSSDEVSGKSVLEVGSVNVNGTPRDHILSLSPSKYLGVDIVKSDCVDEVCSVYDLVSTYGENSFDIVVSTEMLEHVENWRLAISNMKQVCKPGGLIVITTRSIGFGLHNFPEDWWRYEESDMAEIFSDFEILINQPETVDKGIFVKARKPLNFVEKDLSNHSLYNIQKESK